MGIESLWWGMFPWSWVDGTKILLLSLGMFIKFVTGMTRGPKKYLKL